MGYQLRIRNISDDHMKFIKDDSSLLDHYIEGTWPRAKKGFLDRFKKPAPNFDKVPNDWPDYDGYEVDSCLEQDNALYAFLLYKCFHTKTPTSREYFGPTYLGRPGFSSSSGMDSKQLVQFHAFVSSYDKSCFYNSPEDEAKELMDDLVFWTSEQPLDDDDISFMEDEMSVVLNLVEKGVASNLGLMWYWG